MMATEERNAYNRDQKARRRAVLEAEAIADIVVAKLADKLADILVAEVVHRMSAAIEPVGLDELEMSADGTHPAPKGQGVGGWPSAAADADRGRDTVDNAPRTRTTNAPPIVARCERCGHLVVNCQCRAGERAT